MPVEDHFERTKESRVDSPTAKCLKRLPGQSPLDHWHNEERINYCSLMRYLNSAINIVGFTIRLLGC